MLKGRKHSLSFYIFFCSLIVRIILFILELTFGLKIIGVFTLEIINFCILISAVITAVMSANNILKYVVYTIANALIIINIIVLLPKLDAREININTPNNKNTLVVIEDFRFRTVNCDLYKKSFIIFKKSLNISLHTNEADRPFSNKKFTLTQLDDDKVHLDIQGRMSQKFDIDFKK